MNFMLGQPEKVLLLFSVLRRTQNGNINPQTPALDFVITVGPFRRKIVLRY